MSEIQYAVQPGTVTLHDGVTTKTWTAADLAAAYGVDATPYLTINSMLDLPTDPRERMKILVLMPRSDDIYENIMYTAEDDGQSVAYRPDFDGSKQFIQETDPENIYPDEAEEEKLEDSGTEMV